MEVVTLILKHDTTARIFNQGVDSAARDEILAAFSGEQPQGEKTNAIQLAEEDANAWLERLREGSPVDQVLAAKLNAAFAGELGGFVEPSTFWTVQG